MSDDASKSVDALIELMQELETVEEMAHQLRVKMADISIKLVA